MQVSEPDDGELLERDFAALFDRHAAALHRYVARRIGLTIAEDIVAKTFHVAYERQSAYDCTRPDARVTDRVDACASSTDMAAALAELPAADREVMLHFAWAQLAYLEIADALDIPVGTVRSRLHRARARRPSCASTDVPLMKLSTFRVTKTHATRGPVRSQQPKSRSCCAPTTKFADRRMRAG